MITQANKTVHLMAGASVDLFEEFQEWTENGDPGSAYKFERVLCENDECKSEGVMGTTFVENPSHPECASWVCWVCAERNDEV